jgi:hypothetical protein
VKDEGSKLGAMTTTSKFVVNCDNLRLEEPFQGTFLGQAMSKACQCGTIDEKVSVGLHKTSIKFAQANFQKCIMWLKRLRKRHEEWTKACIDARL